MKSKKYSWARALQILSVLFVVLLSIGCKQNIKQTNLPSEFELLLKANIAELNKYAKSHSSFSSSEVKLAQTNYINYDLLPDYLKRKLDVKFYGDVNKFLNSLSAYCGFSFNVRGLPSSSPNNIYINNKNKMLVDVLSDVGAQLSDDIIVNVDVDVEKESFNVQLIYPNK